MKARHKAAVNGMISQYLIFSANFLAPLITFPFLASILQLEEFGLLTVAYAFCGFGLVLSDFGFGYSAPQQYATARVRDKTLVLSAEITIIRFFMTLLAAVLSSLAHAFFFHFEQSTLSFAVFIYVLSNALNFLWYQQGRRRQVFISLIISGTKLASIPIVILIALDYRFEFVIMAQALLVTAGWAIIVPYRDIRRFAFYRVNWLGLNKTFLFSAPLMWLNFTHAACQTSATVVASLFFSSQWVGVIGFCLRFSQIGQNMISPISQALIPLLAKPTRTFGTDRYAHVGAIAQISVAVLYFAGVSAVCLFGLDQIGEGRYSNYYNLILISAFIPVFSAVARGYGFGFLFSIGDVRSLGWISTLSFCVSVCSLILLGVINQPYYLIHAVLFTELVGALATLLVSLQRMRAI